jgi:hypothetical protein
VVRVVGPRSMALISAMLNQMMVVVPRQSEKVFCHQEGGMSLNAVATDTQIIRELCIWTAVFISFGIFAVANAQ